MTDRERIDKLMVRRQLAGSRERARALIMAGRVLVDERPVDKAGTQIDSEATIRLKGEDIPYVSRGGLKLARALEVFQVTVAGRVALDVGASTGGFTDCLLQNGARKVFAVDVGYG
ncbi:MAG: SAM-dependent methyltransferase, partial [Desulfuromonadales bacterium]